MYNEEKTLQAQGVEGTGQNPANISAHTNQEWLCWLKVYTSIGAENRGPTPSSARKLILNFLFSQLAWPTLFSQVGIDPGESLQRVFYLCDVLGKTLCSSCHHVSASTYNSTPHPELLTCEIRRFCSKVTPPAHVFSIDIPRQSRIAQTSCLTAYLAQFLPAFPQWWDCSPALLFYRMRRLPLHFID